MWRVLIYLAIIAALAFGAVWLSEQPGSVAFVWQGTSYSVGLAVAALALLVLIALILLIEAAARVIMNLPQRLSFASRERRKRKGIQALSRGMIAVGSGDENAARRYAREVERYLRKDEPLLLLLRAQAAQVSGDRATAEQTFQEMAENEETRILGLRGLYVEARRRGDHEIAYRHASEAARLAPAVDWANEAVLEGLCARGEWRTAIDMVERRAALGLIDKATAKRHRAVLLTADALSRGERDEEGALASVKEAVRLAPDLVPAAALAGQILGRRLELRKASKIVEAAWQLTPHPELASVYTHLRAGDSTHDRMERAERLATLASWGPEGRLALARAALEAHEYGKARETMRPLLQERPSVRACLLMADIERLEHGNSGRAREWLARAVHAPRDKAWIADGVVSDRWSPISPVSGRLDAFRWDTPPELSAGLGASVIDDVIADLDDHPGSPLPLAAPTFTKAEEAQILEAEPVEDRTIDTRAEERAAQAAREAEKRKREEEEAARREAAEKERLENERAERERSERERAAREEAERKAALAREEERRAAEREREERERREREDAERAAREQAERERAEKERAEEERRRREREEREAAEKRAAEKKPPEPAARDAASGSATATAPAAGSVAALHPTQTRAEASPPGTGETGGKESKGDGKAKSEGAPQDEDAVLPLPRLPDDPGPLPRKEPERKRSRFNIFGSN